MLIGHKKQWEFLKKKFELNQLSHAYLFTGAKEIGKRTFVIEFAKLITCKDKNSPCQKCFSCQAIERGNFPDFKIITKKDDKTEIDISQIREAQNFLSYKSYYGSFKIVVVDGAEKMNQEAQSCFLKTLEEPKGQTLLVIISSNPDMMLQTINSRCQTIKFFKPKDLPVNSERLKKEEEILKELIPVINSNLADKFKYVKSIDFEKQNLSEILEVMQKYLRRLLLVETGVEKKKENDVPGLINCSIKKIKNIINLVENINNKLLFTNVNPKLALEILLMEF